MGIFTLILGVVFGLLWVAGLRKYPLFVKTCSAMGNPYGRLLLPGRYLIGLILYRPLLRKYRSRISARLNELYRHSENAQRMEIHGASKCSLLLFTAWFLSFVAWQTQPDVTYALFSIGVLGALFFLYDKQLDEKIRKRRRSIQLDFPEFLSKLALLVNAGLTATTAITRISKDAKRKRPLYDELSAAIKEIEGGKPEAQVYEDFARRCRVPEVSTFVAILIQNLRKGNGEMVPLLRLQADSCWEDRKNTAKKLGEEAATKLVFPMALIFIAILIMLLAPAVMQLNV